MKVAVYTSADEPYLAPSVVALESFRRFQPEWSYFLLGNRTRISGELRRLLDRHRIEFIHVEDRKFQSTTAFPIECFYIFYGPELFLNRGFDYSLAIDADVFCLRPIELEELSAVEGYAGRVVQSLDRTLEYLSSRSGRNVQELAALFGVCEKTGTEINTGFVIWNNAVVKRAALQSACARTFQSVPELFRSDQDLLAVAASIVDLPLKQIGWTYNSPFINGPMLEKHSLYQDLGISDPKSAIYEQVRVIHFLAPKPWGAIGEATSPAHRYFISEWAAFAASVLGNDVKFLPAIKQVRKPLLKSLAKRIKGFLREIPILRIAVQKIRHRGGSS